eukprot:COSAG04_NODE_17317_length_472_cov_1.378016_1_plen_59_part_10
MAAIVRVGWSTAAWAAVFLRGGYMCVVAVAVLKQGFVRACNTPAGQGSKGCARAMPLGA